MHRKTIHDKNIFTSSSVIVPRLFRVCSAWGQRLFRVCSASDPHRSGFAILFSVLLASFLITLGLSIFSISLKELQINTSVRDSQVAYYIADSARECALYWDIKEGAFPACLDNSGGGNCTASASMIQNITCNGIPFILNFVKKEDGLTFWTGSSPILDFFQLSSTSSSTPVADIRITKEFNPLTDGTRIRTTMETWGHNTGIVGRRVERGISIVNN